MILGVPVVQAQALTNGVQPNGVAIHHGFPLLPEDRPTDFPPAASDPHALLTNDLAQGDITMTTENHTLNEQHNTSNVVLQDLSSTNTFNNMSQYHGVDPAVHAQVLEQHEESAKMREKNAA